MVWLLVPGDYEFPHVSHADEYGLVAVGGDLSPERLIAAYRAGIYPCNSPAEPLLWWSPDPRGIMPISDPPENQRLKRALRTKKFEYRINTAFGEVIRSCAKTHAAKSHSGQWITPDMVEAYERLHALGHAHSVETWSDGKLAGGLYGVAIG